MNRFAAATFLALAAGTALAQPPGRRADSPAAAPVPETLREQSFPDELIAAGRTQFVAQCGFCHGLDTAGGSGGPDLTRSDLVARDFRGDEIGPVVRQGRPNAELPMPAFPALGSEDLDAIVAFIHDQKARAESVEGGRQAVSVEDVLSGDAEAGRRYFEQQCADCHSAAGDLRGIASRSEGLDLMRRMLNPAIGFGSSIRATPRAEIRGSNGEVFIGLLAFEDEFTIAITDADGRYRSFSKRAIGFEIDDPLQRHRELLAAYTDDDMHDVLAYLHTLR